MSIIKKRVWMQTYGCQMNQADSETAMGVLDRSNLEIEFVSDSEQADLILINTCSIRDHAENRVFNLLSRLRDKKKRHPDLIVGVLGCMVAEHKEKLLKKFSHIDFVCTQRDVDNIPTYIADAMEKKKNISIIKTGLGSRQTMHAYREDPVRAMITITHGCDNHCSYCIVPYVRGREISRPMKEVLEEVVYLRDKGFKQFMFLGQNVNSYGKGLPAGENFVSLLEAASKIDGVELIQFMTPHPHDVNVALIDLIAENPKIAKHLHFPVQSGSNRILEKMRRDYSREEYLGKVALLKERIADVSITTDIIVGFCEETEEDFEQTLSLMREVRFDMSYIFKYSPRQKTFAYKWEDDVSAAIKEERLQRALTLQKELSEQRNRSLEGKTFRALLAKKGSKQADELLAVTWNDKLALIPNKSDLFLGKTVSLRLTQLLGGTNTFRGEVLAAS